VALDILLFFLQGDSWQYLGAAALATIVAAAGFLTAFTLWPLTGFLVSLPFPILPLTLYFVSHPVFIGVVGSVGSVLWISGVGGLGWLAACLRVWGSRSHYRLGLRVSTSICILRPPSL